MRYKMALWKNSQVDNPCSSLSAQEKLDELETRQRNWLALQPRVTEEIVIEGSTSVYEMQEGLLLWCPRDQPQVRSTEVQLLSLPTGDPRLRKMVTEEYRDTECSILDLHLDPTQDLLVLSEAM